MKRFYREAAVAADADGHGVLLDGRPLRTPAKRPLAVPSAALAEAIAAEWGAQEEDIRPADMPLTRLASTATDRMPEQSPAAIEEIAGYATTELLCYRADQPFDLVRRQQRIWQPLLDWAAATYGARLEVTTGVVPVPQPEVAVRRLRAAVEALDDWSLVGMHAATTTLSSLVLALALAEGRLDAEAALEASLLDELFEIERWGRDVETERRQARLRREVEAAALFLVSLRATEPPDLKGA